MRIKHPKRATEVIAKNWPKSQVLDLQKKRRPWECAKACGKKWSLLTHSLSLVISQTATPVADTFGNAISDSKGRDGSFIVRRNRCAILHDQKVTCSRQMAAQSYGFRALWKRKRLAPSLLVLRLKRRSSDFLQANRLNTRSNDGECKDLASIKPAHARFKKNQEVGEEGSIKGPKGAWKNHSWSVLKFIPCGCAVFRQRIHLASLLFRGPVSSVGV